MGLNKVLSLLSLAEKAGKIQSGEFSTEKSIKASKAALVIVALDASANTKKMFTNMCHYYRVPLYFYSGKEELGHSTGKSIRASLAVTDAGFGKQLVKLLDVGQQNGGSEYDKTKNT